MRNIFVIALLLFATPVMATVGGGDIILKNKGGDVVFSHGTHVEGMALACTDCHDKLYLSKGQHKTVTMKQMQKGKSCGTCHNGKKAFSVKGDCAKCHKK
ncbi:MAG: cytochrome c3 family protein [Geobacteraceae bacterium]|nr:cytochrome c3 family protein [Geobacteraceae bacterium]NTW78896.1 cytochrome c3 family protein [Geobacteraceae bacterium]